jgi:hypothetical protein
MHQVFFGICDRYLSASSLKISLYTFEYLFEGVKRRLLLDEI